MDTKMKAYLESWEAVAEIEQQELIFMTIEQRWQKLNAIMGIALGLGLHKSGDDEIEIYQRWAKLKEKASKRYPAA